MRGRSSDLQVLLIVELLVLVVGLLVLVGELLVLLVVELRVLVVIEVVVLVGELFALLVAAVVRALVQIAAAEDEPLAPGALGAQVSSCRWTSRM